MSNRANFFEYQNGKHQPNDSKSSFALKMQLQGEYIGKMTEHNSRLTSERNEQIEANYINNKISNAIEQQGVFGIFFSGSVLGKMENTSFSKNPSQNISTAVTLPKIDKI